MWYLCLDESGDLGFDFVNKKPSRHFTVCLLVTSDPSAYYAIRRAVQKTLRRKVNKSGRARQLKSEIKATDTSLEAKRYFYKHVADLRFGLYALTLDKRRVFERLTGEKERVYNFVTRLVLDRIPFEQADDRVQLLIDRSKGKADIQDFNRHVFRQTRGRLHPMVALHTDHVTSQQEPILQAVDLFAWGVFRKYEKGDSAWFDVFKEKVRCCELYPESE
jgi:hypothetical protein